MAKLNWNEGDLQKHLEGEFKGWHFEVTRNPFNVKIIEETTDYAFMYSVEDAVNKWFKDKFGRDYYIEWNEPYWDTYHVKAK